MAGVKGSGGPPPKRSDQRRRKNKPAAGEATKADGAELVAVPPADEAWHPIAKQWYESLALSGQSHFYEPSDWSTAFFLAESMNRELQPQGIVYQGKITSYELMTVKAGSISALLKGMSDLMVTEGSRRRVALELQRPRGSGDGDGGAPAKVTDLRSWKAGLSG